MAKKMLIRSANDLPEWFCLESYRGLQACGADDWYDFLLQRYTHKYFIRSEGGADYKESDVLYNVLLRSRDDPIARLVDTSEILLIGGGKLAALKFSPNLYVDNSSAICPLTLRRLYQVEGTMDKSGRSRLRDWFAALFDMKNNNEGLSFLRTHSDWAKDNIDLPIFEAMQKIGNASPGSKSWQNRKFDLIEIDLRVPDKILKEQFADYLSSIRKRSPTTIKAEPYKSPDFGKWIEYSILPYLDLSIWAEEVQVAIPHRVMADAIFQDGTKGEEVIRKTTGKIADQLMEDQYLEFLSTIAAEEKRKFLTAKTSGKN